VVGVFAGYVGDLFNFSLFNFSLLYYFLGCFFLPFLFSFIVIYVYAYEYYISIHYLLYVTLCGQFCSWVNKAIINKNNIFMDSFVLGLIKLLLLLLLLLILINCENHTHETILKFIITSTTNTLLKNYWGKSND
jgi:hypothetical protein